jgi:hypothetical protein
VVGRGERPPRPPALGEIAERGGRLRGVSGEGTPESEVGGGAGVGLAEPEREVVGGPRTEAVEGGDRGDQLIEADASIEPNGILGDCPGEQPNTVRPARSEP